ncbi:unnamed protein product [Musa acuminata subsp. malaccensis]|uniref:(wild Malaysian banana) hypothetical protein n=1 Tax=Musa acuminata subsp. malaccensis TaxID=214687 RepID=A0A804KX03_MUSAM|nr:unnamed protein product [Musa acuminata subsp. malaccensis]
MILSNDIFNSMYIYPLYLCVLTKFFLKDSKHPQGHRHHDSSRHQHSPKHSLQVPDASSLMPAQGSSPSSCLTCKLQKAQKNAK